MAFFIPLTRRGFIKRILTACGLLMLGPPVMTSCSGGSSGSDGASPTDPVPDPAPDPTPDPTPPLEGSLFRAVNGDPAGNMTKVVELMGGIGQIAGPDDLVIIKPNVQWWNQGAPNLLALKTFVSLILDRPEAINAEVVIAENCHRGPVPEQSEIAGWSQTFSINSDLPGIRNFNDLCALLKQEYRERFSVCHWINVESGGQRIHSPADGPGYIYCDGTGGTPLLKQENGAQGVNRRATIMTYPVFLTDRGTLVDFKDGVWDKGRYTDQPVKFINFAALNHHSHYCGMTSAVKNYLGITDLSGGADPHDGGKLTDTYYNFHSFPFDGWADGPVPGMLGAQIGTFMTTIRRADLNITTAEWIGLGSRVDPPVSRTRAVLASRDAVALDCHSAKYILYPNSQIAVHNPDDPNSPVGQYLNACAENGGGVFGESTANIRSWDFTAGRLQTPDEFVQIGEKKWGFAAKPLLKYMLFRYASSAM